MNRPNRYVGAFVGAVMLLCVLASIQIGHQQYLGQWVLHQINLPFNRYAVGALFVLAWLAWNKTMKNEQAFWISWGRIGFTLLMLLAMISYIVM